MDAGNEAGQLTEAEKILSPMLAQKNHFEESPRIKLSLPASQNVKMLLLKKSNNISLHMKRKDEQKTTTAPQPVLRKSHSAYKTMPDKL